MDDVAVPIASETNDGLQAAVRRTTKYVADALHARGQEFSRGKTELLINYRGRGAREHRKKTFLDDTGTIRIHDGDRVYPQ